MNAASFKAAFYSFSDKPTMTPFSRKDFYKIWLINNEGILTLGKQQISIKQPTLVFLNPLTPYAFESIAQERTGYWCIFTGEFLKNESYTIQHRVFNMEEPGIFIPAAPSLEVIIFLFEQIVADYNSDYSLKYQSIQSKIVLLIHEANKLQPFLVNGQRRNAASRIVNSFLNLLEKQYPIATPQEPLKLKKPSDFAAELAVHVNHLNAVVHELTGKTTRDHIAERMLAESKALLRFSDWSVADIAYSLGFEYPNHFNNFFRKHTGITPLSLRK